MVNDDVALKMEGVHVRGQEMRFKDFIKLHVKKRPGDGSQRKGGNSFVSDDILRQLQVEFPWMSIEELRQLIAKQNGQLCSQFCNHHHPRT